MLTAALSEIEARLGGGTLGVAALCDGEATFYNADTVFPTASSIKIAIVEVLFRRVAAGTLDLDQPVTLTQDELVGGSGVLATLTTPLTLPLRDLVTLTLTVSDNTASNACLRAVGGPDALNKALTEWGLKNTTVHRPIQFHLGPDDPPHTATGTPRDFLTLLSLLGPQTRQVMAQVNDTAMLPRFLALNPYADALGVRAAPFTVAHKPGAVTGVRNDVGWIERDGRELAIAVFTQGCPDPSWTVENLGCLAVAQVAQCFVEHYFGAP